MCGITGFVSYTKKLNEEDLKIMNNSLEHRGPDAAGYYLKNEQQLNIALGHRRLSIIDLSNAANQPMYSSCGRYVMVYNGEVYNYHELKSTLLVNFAFKTQSDTEVILESFVKSGIKAVESWNGMFALAIWDIQDQKLTLIRDRIGKKPLYYYWDGTSFAFASELKALKLVGLPLTPSKKAIATYLNVGYIPQPLSIYNEVKKLPPGSYLELDDKQVSVKKYWTPSSILQPLLINNEAEAKAILKELLVSSVKYRMISDVPFGAFLSGGVDSSLVTAIAQSINEVPVKTFSIGFKEKSFNESGYAKRVADHLGTDHHAIQVSEQEGLALINDITGVYDEPYADVSAVPTMLVSKFASEQVKMVISGDGGDELFSGYGTYDWAERLANPVTWAGRKIAGSALKLGNVSFKKAGALMDVSSNRNLQQHIFSQEQGFFSYKDISKHFSVGDPAEVFDHDKFARNLTPREVQSLFDLEYYLPDDLLVKIDRAAMRYGLEGRCPILDYRIVEFALNLHPDLKKKGKTVKYLLKQVLYDYLPEQYFNRPKWGFAFPLEKLMKNELSYLIDSYLSKEVTVEVGICNNDYIQKLVNKYRTGQTYVYYKLWTVIQLHKWFLENN